MYVYGVSNVVPKHIAPTDALRWLTVVQCRVIVETFGCTASVLPRRMYILIWCGPVGLIVYYFRKCVFFARKQTWQHTDNENDMIKPIQSLYSLERRAPLKFHTKLWTHTPQNVHFTVLYFCVWVTISLNCDVISLSETGPWWWQAYSLTWVQYWYQKIQKMAALFVCTVCSSEIGITAACKEFASWTQRFA